MSLPSLSKAFSSIRNVTPSFLKDSRWKFLGEALCLGGTAWLVYRFARTWFQPGEPFLPPAPFPAPGLKASPSPVKVVVESSIAVGISQDPLPKIDAVPWEEAPFFSFYRPERISTPNGGVSTSIGMHASVLLPGGNALYHRQMNPMPGCPFVKMYREEDLGDRIEMCFKERNYALRLFASLKELGLDCSWKEIDETPEGELEGHDLQDYYHGAIVFQNPASFVFFARHLCQQSFQDMADFVKARRRKERIENSNFLSAIERTNIEYKGHEHPYLHWTKQIQFIPDTSISVPPKSAGVSLSTSIGIASALLVPGRTSFLIAIQGKEIPIASLREEKGLTIEFPDIFHPSQNKIIKTGSIHAQKTQEGLAKINLAFQIQENILSTAEPKAIVLYLFRLCGFTREDIATWVAEEHMDQIELGKAIINASKSPLEGEENYEVCLLMNEADEIPLEKLSLNPARFLFEPIPDVPDSYKSLDVYSELPKVFKALEKRIQEGGFLDGKKIHHLNQGIENILSVLKGEPYSGVPASPKEKQKFIEKMFFIFKHIFFLLPYAEEKEKTIDICALSLAQIAIGGMACAGGHVQAILSVYQSLKRFSPLSVHHSVAQSSNLPEVDRQVHELIEGCLSQLRSSLFQQIAEKYRATYGGDIAHLKNEILQKIGVKRAIAGTELALYADPYLALAHKISKEQMLLDFDRLYSPQAIVSHLKGMVAYKQMDMDPVIDFLKRHAPETYRKEGELPDNFLGEVLEDDWTHLKDLFIKQMLIISGHLLYQ